MVSKLLSAALVATAIGIGSESIAAPVNVDVVVGAPPPLRYEVVPAPRPGYVWTPGYWDWRYNRHYWVGGTWVRQRPGYVYSQPAWVQREGRWSLQRGGWGHGDYHHDHDHDRDGVPNRYDHHPDNPYRR